MSESLIGEVFIAVARFNILPRPPTTHCVKVALARIIGTITGRIGGRTAFWKATRKEEKAGDKAERLGVFSSLFR
jgi:hypothetical protein